MVKVTQSRKGEGCREIETHSETKCEEGDPKRKRGSRIFNEREAGESLGLGQRGEGG